MLSLVEEVLLLTFHDKTGRARRLPEYSIEFAVAGAVLADLALLDRIDSDLESVMVVEDSPTGDRVHDAVLRDLAAAKGRQDVKHWIMRFARVESIRHLALDQLADKGILRPKKWTLPFAVGRRRYEVVDPAVPRSSKARIREVLTTDAIPDPRDILLVCLVHACSLLRTVMDRRDLRAAGERIEKVARMDLIGQVMLRELQETWEVINRVGWWGVNKIELEPGPDTGKSDTGSSS